MGDIAVSEITVEIVYALPHVQVVARLRVPRGTTIEQALVLSNITARHPEININTVPVGIFGRRLSTDVVLNDHDRIEIYRPLLADPKRSRRTRARQFKVVPRKK
jgi:hypothetical protein